MALLTRFAVTWLTLALPGTRKGARSVLPLVWAALAFAGVFNSQAQAQAATEYDIKAVFLYNCTRFVEWPGTSEADKPLVIGVLGQDPFGARLDDALRGEKSNNRPLVVKRLQSLEEALTCEVVFIARSEQAALPQILQRLGGHPILTVSDIPSFAESGGMVGLMTEKDKVRLQINVDASKLASLSISAKLLRPAQIVSTRKTSQFNFAPGTHYVLLLSFATPARAIRAG